MSGKDEVEIASVGYRIAHWINLFLYTTLLLTGLVLFEIEIMAYILYPFAEPIAKLLRLEYGTGSITAGVLVSRFLHRFVGPLWGLLLTIYVVYLLATNRLEMFKALRKPLKAQIREAKALIQHYLTGKEIPEDVRQGMDRHNVLTVYLAILLAIGVIMVGFSGLALIYLPLPPTQHILVLMIHDVGFYLTVIFMLAHIYATLHPSNITLVRAIFGDGKVSLNWLSRHMNRYIQRAQIRR